MLYVLVVYLFGKDKHGFQKYRCKSCKRQFTLEHNKSKSQNKVHYFPCHICGKATFIWHKYDSYIHFKCGNKSVIIFVPHLIKPDFNLHFTNPFKYFKFSPIIILTSLSLYFDSPSSLRQVQRSVIRFCSIYVSHVSIYNWIRHFSHIFKDISNFFLSNSNLYSDEWHIDETYIKINSITHYLWIVIESETRVIISFHLSSKRDSNNALKVIENSCLISNIQVPVLVTDNRSAYDMPIKICYPNSVHYSYNGFDDYLNNNLIESFNKTFKAWYKTKKGFKNFDVALSSITNFIFHYNFIRAHSSLNDSTPAEVAGVEYLNRKPCDWLLF